MTTDTPGPSRVLVADDDADIRALLLLSLRTAGFAVHAAAGGTDALTAALRGQYDVLVLDVQMPDLSGLQVCRRLKSGLDRWASPVLLISANCSLEDIAAGQAAGADDYLPKPFSPRELVQRVGQLVGQRPRWNDHVAATG